MSDEEIVAALAGALLHETWCNRMSSVLDDDDLACADYRLSTARLLLPTVRRVAEQRAAEAVERERAYLAGSWCGECRYGVVEDPPCCARAAALTATPEHGRSAT